MKRYLLFLLTSISYISAKTDHIYCIIMAGGSGERLWPLSRKQMPKQLLSVDGSKSLLEQAIDRIKPLVPNDNIFILTTEQNLNPIINSIAFEQSPQFLIEPSARNTGPAVLFSCISLYEKDPDAILIFIPADAYIPEQDYHSYVNSLEKLIFAAEHHTSISLLGVKPTHPATGYGYIEYDQSNEQNYLYSVCHFHEKPSIEKAQYYLTQSNILWNIGVFCSKASVFINEFKLHAPALFESVINYIHHEITYDSIESISIDYVLIEKSESVKVLPVVFSWCDVGNIYTFLSFNNVNQKMLPNCFVAKSSENLIAAPQKLVALVGVDNLCVVDTGDVLLIAKKDHVEEIRSIVNQLKQSAFAEYL